jgi:3D (Asp-Asp-Asp) domain-containing protein
MNNVDTTAYDGGPNAPDKAMSGGGATASGYLPGPGTIAVDPKVFTVGKTVMNVPGWGWGTALDTGNAIKGKHLDLWVPTLQGALNWGHRLLSITVCR